MSSRDQKVERQRHQVGRLVDVAPLQLRVRELLAREGNRLRIGFRSGLLQETFEQRHLTFEVFQRAVEIAERLDDLCQRDTDRRGIR